MSCAAEEFEQQKKFFGLTFYPLHNLRQNSMKKNYFNSANVLVGMVEKRVYEGYVSFSKNISRNEIYIMS